MILLLTGSWWSLLLRGIAALLFGILTLIWPALSLQVLVLLFGAYVLVDGIFAIAAGVSRRKEERSWWILLLHGLVGIVAGVLAFVWPQITALALLFVIAAWAIVTGVLQLVAAVRLRKAIEGEWLLALSGIASVLFGVGAALFPGAGALAVVVVIGVYALFLGGLHVALAFRLRRLREWANVEIRPAGQARAS